ncbi:hypothetical protein GJ633_13440 [Halorubrum sp. CBA1125]|nr:hypothetical protein [Halorubrum sp. CBA1125]
MIDRLRRVLRVARWEVARAGGGVDRRTLAAALALLLVGGGVLGAGLAAGAVGFDVDRGVYRVASPPIRRTWTRSPGIRRSRPYRSIGRFSDRRRTSSSATTPATGPDRNRLPASPSAPATRGRGRPRRPRSARRSRPTTSA